MGHLCSRIFWFLQESINTSPTNFPLDLTKDFILYILTSTYVVTGVLIQESDDRSEHIIYYIINILSDPSINYNHDEKIDLVVVLSTQNLHHYILTCTTKVVANSNPMQYILGLWLITSKFTQWIIIYGIHPPRNQERVSPCRVHHRLSHRKSWTPH